jgi:putative CocE/NonD family hydrolase
MGQARNRYHQFGARLGGAVELAAGVGWFATSGSKLYYRPPPGTPRDVWLRMQDRFDPAPAPRREWTRAPAAGDSARDVRLEKLWWVLPIIDIPTVGGFPPTDFEQIARLEPADPWWGKFGYLTDSSRFDVPALHINSWYDFGPLETMTQWEMFQTNAVSARGRDNQFAVIAPTTHCSFERATERTIVGERDVGDARFDWSGLYLRWFDHWLRGADNGVTRMPKVQYYLMGKNEWRSANAWPIPGTRFTRFYLHSGGNANSRAGDGTLGTRPPANEPPDRYVYDPRTPTPSRGGPICCTGSADAPEGSFDQSDVEMRSDILVYTTPPLTEGVEVTGPLKAVLYVSSSAKDTDFTAKLLDVHPDGRAFNLQEGILRARYREGYDRTVFMEPGGVYEVVIDMQATGNYFPPGHRIRLEIASANFPRFDRNLNTGGNNFDETRWEVARNTVHHTARYPSHVVLPIVPADRR